MNREDPLYQEKMARIISLITLIASFGLILYDMSTNAFHVVITAALAVVAIFSLYVFFRSKDAMDPKGKYYMTKVHGIIKFTKRSSVSPEEYEYKFSNGGQKNAASNVPNGYVKCPSCNAVNLEKSQHCQKCGKKL